jgi:hypothetical protein
MTSDVVKRVVDIVSQLELLDDDDDDGEIQEEDASSPKTSISELCQIHDALMEERISASQRGAALDIVRFRLVPSSCAEENKMGLDVELVAVEADVYRSTVGISMHLLQVIADSTTVSKVDDSIKEGLQHTIRQCTLLLKILSTMYSLSCGKNSNDLTTAHLPSQYPILHRWIEEMEQRDISNWEEETSNLISFDRQQLASEEDELLFMANTPTPLESSADDANHLNYDNSMQEEYSNHPYTGMVARMSSKFLKKETIDAQTSVQICMDHRGVIRLRDMPENHWWAALTPSSSTNYKSPTFTITSVAIPILEEYYTKVRLSLSTITLEVGRDGRQWWEATSAVIQQLNDLQSLQDEVGSLWPHDQVQIQNSAASTAVVSGAAMMDLKG